MTSPLSKLGLGSGQFALEQATVRGRPPQAEVRDILDIAARARLTVFDVTGRSPVVESALGDIMPRPNPFKVSISTVRADRGPDFVEAEARATLRRLGVEQADAILVPSAADLFGPHGLALWDRLKALKERSAAAGGHRRRQTYIGLHQLLAHAGCGAIAHEQLAK